MQITRNVCSVARCMLLISAFMQSAELCHVERNADFADQC